MPEIRIEPRGADELTTAVEKAIEAWIKSVRTTTAARWPGADAWGKLVDRFVTPVSEKLYRAGVATVSGEALDAFIGGVRTRLAASTLVADIKAAQREHGDAALDMDWPGASGDALPWRSRAQLIGENEAQQTAGQAAVDSSPSGAMKVWRSKGDGKVRKAHKDADGQRVPVAGPFRVGGEDLLYPGDTRASAANGINCRCAMYMITEETAVKASITVDKALQWAPRDTEWDPSTAIPALTEWATDDGTLDEDKLAKAYLWRTEGPSDEWLLPVATVIDGEAVLVLDAINAAAEAVMSGDLGLSEDDDASLRESIEGLYQAASEAYGEEIPAAWAMDAALASLIAAYPGKGKSLIAALTALVKKAQAEERRSLMASALNKAIKGDEWTPEAAWFQPPDGSQKELISTDGRVSGYIATWDDAKGGAMCHAGYAAEGICEPVPRGGDYSYFHPGNVSLTLDDGTQVHPGLLTMDIGHTREGGVDDMIAHHDNPRAIAAAVIAGEDDTGIWMAGSVLPKVMEDADKFTRLRLSTVSGEWTTTRPGGPMELVAVTAVNRPGFPQRSKTGYELAASLSASKLSDLELFKEQLAYMAGTVNTLLSGVETPEADTEKTDAPPVDTPVYPDGVDKELVDAALLALKNKEVKASSVPHGVTLPKSLQILADHLSGTGTDGHHARAAAVQAAENICRSTDTQHAAVRIKACRLVSEFRAKK
ncbi:hypothetical protein ABT282_30970 [Streptomyces sp. NPDC000927]|uniref:hypothetical protein n=1 Tax=Streptomyces sp. NPDC000927 TaxID=3154371 RepID=UPI00331B4098